MTKLARLLYNVPYSILSDTRLDDSNFITGVSCDSRKVEKGHVFIAISGDDTDGHNYIQEAVFNGCIAVVVEKKELPKLLPEIMVILVEDTHHTLGLIASNYFSNPASQLKMIGITGTNGKTTTSWILENILHANSYKTGIIGTVYYRYLDRNDKEVCHKASLTTPEPLLLHQLLRTMVDNGVSHVVMEVSSHALAQKRIAGISFDAAIFTNLSRDHLDFHQTMEKYFAAKQKLFLNHLSANGSAVVATQKTKIENSPQKQISNWGENLGEILENEKFTQFASAQNKTTRKTLTCGFNSENDIFAENIRLTSENSFFDLDIFSNKNSIQTPLTGQFNIQNILCAVGAAYTLGLSTKSICKTLTHITPIPGRLENIKLPGCTTNIKAPTIFVDFAHSPDSLENVLKSLQAIKKRKLICIFGCGGDRDSGKRPLMGEISSRLADITILTSDNPRSDPPRQILKEIEQGIKFSDCCKMPIPELFNPNNSSCAYTVIAERKAAIHYACSLADHDDIILIAGKGHETYQIIGNKKTFFDDRVEAINGLLTWNTSHLLQATGGVLVQGQQNTCFTKITTDSRSIKENEIFIALCGENFDGHEYLQTATKKGATALIINKDIQIPDINPDTIIIKVKDTLQALGDLASYRRSLLGPHLKVIAITGSSGKTTVKEMTSAILQKHYNNKQTADDHILATKGNFNNLIGLPLSLLPIQAHHKIAILEMGMNSLGEISRLTEIAQPDIGCITNVQPAHLEGLSTIENVALAKTELFATMTDDSIRIINLDDKHLKAWQQNTNDVCCSFTATDEGIAFNPDIYATNIISLKEQGMRFTLHVNAWKAEITLPVPGIHNVSNALAAAAIATHCDTPPEIICQALTKYNAFDKRMEFDHLPGGIKVVNDTYNANPASMSAALKTVSSFGSQSCHIAILGDMLELGESSEKAHKDIGSQVSAYNFDYLAVTGKFATYVAIGAIEQGMNPQKVRICKDKEIINQWLLELIKNKEIKENDWILLKGSRGMRMEKLLVAVKECLSSKDFLGQTRRCTSQCP